MRLAAFVLACALAGAGCEAHAQAYPSKPVRLILSFPAGASMDLTARAVGQRVAEGLGQPIVVENRAGGNTIVSAEAAALAAPDGYTLFMALDTTMTLLPSLYAKIPYDPLKDFAPVSQISRASYILVANAKAPFRNIAELVAHARANPGRMNFGASTAFTQVLTILLRSSAGVDVAYVPYKGTPPMLQALMAGELDVVVDAIPLYVPLIRQGKMAAIATTGSDRAHQLPDTPTVREAGYAQLEADSWTGWFAPARTPDAVVRRMNGELVRVLGNAEFRQKMLDSGQNPLYSSTPEQLGAMVKEGLARWAPIVRAAGIKLDQ